MSKNTTRRPIRPRRVVQPAEVTGVDDKDGLRQFLKERDAAAVRPEPMPDPAPTVQANTVPAGHAPPPEQPPGAAEVDNRTAYELPTYEFPGEFLDAYADDAPADTHIQTRVPADVRQIFGLGVKLLGTTQSAEITKLLNLWVDINRNAMAAALHKLPVGAGPPE